MALSSGESTIQDDTVENSKGEMTDGEHAPGEPDDSFIVWWESDQDPENPQNWTTGRKWGIIGLLSFITFLTPLASAMIAPGVPLLLAEFNTTSNTLATFVVSVFVLGFASGPLLVAPLSEIYGRSVVYNVCNVFFVIFSVLCGEAVNMGMMIACRFLAGFSGVAVVTIGGGSIADLMPPEKRGGAMAAWSLGPLLGPIIGPVAAGFMVDAIGWRWVFRVISIAAGGATVASFFVLRETYAPTILERKAARRRKETGNARYRSKLQKDGTSGELFGKAIIRPARMFIFSPIVMAMCIYIAVVYGLLYLLFTTFTFVYRDNYGFSARGAGLTFLGPGIGSLIGIAFMGVLSDRVIRRQQGKGKTARAEDRLHPVLTVPATILLPIGLIMYGWTADKHVHWVAPITGTGIMAFGMNCILMSIQTYLVDAFPVHAASAMAANTVLRSLLGALLPLCGLQLYDALGLGWGNTLLGLIALALAPAPWIFFKIGERIRTNPKNQREF